MGRLKKIPSFAKGAFLLLIFPLILSPESCEQIEFEPADILFITTDSIKDIGEDNYVLKGSVLNIGQADIIQHGFCWSDLEKPTLSEASIQLGPKEATGGFSSVLSGLKLKTTYYIRAYATTNSGTTYGNEESLRTRPPVIEPIIYDIDGNAYRVVVIETQAWMQDNLRTSRYADGTPIPMVEEVSAWEALDADDKAYSWYNNDPEYAHYGGYYTWAAAMNGMESSNKRPSEVQGVCPDGWHIPSEGEWNVLQIHLGMNPNEANRIGFIGSRQDIGTKMKGEGDPLWGYIDDRNFNSSGFSALPVGMRITTGTFENFIKNTYFWSSTEVNENEAWDRNLQNGSAILRNYVFKDYGFSVRCVMD